MDASSLVVDLQDSDFVDSTTTSASRKKGHVCAFCRERHIKCSGGIPCAQCVRRGKTTECRYAVSKKRGPKPKKDLYEYCNKLLVELEVQKQIAAYWKAQFMNTINKTELSQTASNDANAAPSVGPLFAAELTLPSMDEGAELQDATDSDTMAYSYSALASPSLLEAQPQQQDQGFYLEQPNPTVSSVGPTNNVECIGVMTPQQAASYLTSFFELMIPVLPEFEIHVSAQCAADAWNYSLEQLESPNVTVEYLAHLFQNAIFAAHGCRCSGAPVTMKRFIKKVEEIMHVLFFKREAQTVPHIAQQLMISLITLCFYYFGDDRDGSKQSVIMLAYQIVSRHRKEIQPAAMHRLYLLMMGLAETQQDRMYWLQESQQLVSQFNITSPIACSLYNIVYVLTSLHPKFQLSVSPPNFDRDQLLDFVERIESVEQTLAALDPNANPMHNTIYVKRLLVLGVKAELARLLNDNENAKQVVDIALQLAIVPSILHMRHPIYYLGLALIVEAAIQLKYPPSTLYNVYEILGAISDVLPVAVRDRHKLAVYFDQNNTPHTTLQTTSEQAFSKTERISKVQRLLAEYDLIHTKKPYTSTAKCITGTCDKNLVQQHIIDVFSKIQRIQNQLSTVAETLSTAAESQVSQPTTEPSVLYTSTDMAPRLMDNDYYYSDDVNFEPFVNLY